jgi:SAM-dependent methyltransferase
MTVPEQPEAVPADPAPSQAGGEPAPVDIEDHVRRDRAAWNADADAYQARNAATLAAGGGMAWGVWQIPESQLGVLGEVAGRTVLELGCGGAQWSVALARAGAWVIGLDLSERQLAHARRLVQASGVPVALVQASGEAVPLADASVDIVVSDYGAMTFADPYRTVPEVARLLRPGGLFAFNTSSPLLELCWPDDAERAGDRLVRDYFGLHRLAADDGMVSFQLPYGEWIRLFRSSGLEILDLIELRPAPDAVSSYRDDQQRAWSRRWPAECIWRLQMVEAARQRPGPGRSRGRGGASSSG